MAKTSTKDATAPVADDTTSGSLPATTQTKDNLPAEYGEYAQYAGSGFENQTQDDYAIPFLGILQALSPQIEENDQLRPGMIFNTVTGESFNGKDGIVFIPATTDHKYIEFKPRDTGGGFVGAHEVASELVQSAIRASSEFGKYSTPDGNELVETFSVYGTAVDEDGNTCDAVIAFSSTKIKKYKAWMTKAKTIQIPLPDGRRIPAPLFAHKYRLKTVQEKNPKGSFHNWDISFDGTNALEARLLPSDPLFQAAVAIKGLIDSGKAKANYEAAGAQGGDDESGAGAGGKPVF